VQYSNTFAFLSLTEKFQKQKIAIMYFLAFGCLLIILGLGLALIPEAFKGKIWNEYSVLKKFWQADSEKIYTEGLGKVFILGGGIMIAIDLGYYIFSL
jgi:hypothetical protein